MWSSLIRSQIQTYFGACVLMFNSIKDDGHRLQLWMQCAMFVCFPIYCLWFLNKHFGKGKLSTPSYIMRYGTMYQNLNTRKRTVYLYTCFFLCRRFIHAFSTVFFQNLYLNLYTNFFSCLFLLKFYLDYRPMVDNFSNRIELFNELFVLLSNYFIIILSDFVPQIEFRYQLGMQIVYMIGIVFISNIALVLYQLLYMLYFNYRHKFSQDKWKKFYKIEPKLINFIVYDII